MDTSEVVTVYMQRPGSIAHLGLGAWFVYATDKVDHVLVYCTGAEAKRHIIQKGYLDTPDLINQLKAYNRRFTEK